MEDDRLDKILEKVSPSTSDKLKRALVSALAEQRVPNLKPDEMRANLAVKYHSLLTKNEFRPGQIVKWKSGLRNRTRPSDDEYGIVIEVLDSPIIGSADESSGSAYFREPLDILVGILDADEGDFLIFHYDSRRFEPVGLAKDVMS